MADGPIPTRRELAQKVEELEKRVANLTKVKVPTKAIEDLEKRVAELEKTKEASSKGPE